MRRAATSDVVEDVEELGDGGGESDVQPVVEGVRQIYKSCLAMNWDNFFISDDLLVSEEVGTYWPLLGTTRRDRMPNKGVPAKL